MPSRRKMSGPIDPENPYRDKNKGPYQLQQMDDNYGSTLDALMRYGPIEALDNTISAYQLLDPNYAISSYFDTIGTPPHAHWDKWNSYAYGGKRKPTQFPSRGAGTRKRLYKGDDKDGKKGIFSRLSEQAVDYIVRNKSNIEREAKKLSDKGAEYISRNKVDIGRDARNATERGIDFLVANKKGIERGAKAVSDKGFEYLNRNKPNIEGVDYILRNKSNIEREAKNLSDKGFDYIRRNKSGIGQAAERGTNEAIDYVIRNKSNIEREAKNLSNRGFDYLSRNKAEIGRKAQEFISRATGTKKRATAPKMAQKTTAASSRQAGFVNGRPVSLKKRANTSMKYFK